MHALGFVAAFRESWHCERPKGQTEGQEKAKWGTMTDVSCPFIATDSRSLILLWLTTDFIDCLAVGANLWPKGGSRRAGPLG